MAQDALLTIWQGQIWMGGLRDAIHGTVTAQNWGSAARAEPLHGAGPSRQSSDHPSPVAQGYGAACP